MQETLKPVLQRWSTAFRRKEVRQDRRVAEPAEAGTPTERFSDQEVDGLERFAEDGLTAEAQPAFQQRGVDPAEIRVELRRVLVEVGQTGMGADQPAAEASSGQQQRLGRSVVGASPTILGECATEFGERHQEHAIQQMIAGQIFDECRERFRQFAQQRRVVVALIRMIVKASDPAAADFAEKEADANVGSHQLGNGPELVRERERGVFRAELAFWSTACTLRLEAYAATAPCRASCRSGLSAAPGDSGCGAASAAPCNANCRREEIVGTTDRAALSAKGRGIGATQIPGTPSESPVHASSIARPSQPVWHLTAPGSAVCQSRSASSCPRCEFG